MIKMQEACPRVSHGTHRRLVVSVGGVLMCGLVQPTVSKRRSRQLVRK